MTTNHNTIAKRNIVSLSKEDTKALYLLSRHLQRFLSITSLRSFSPGQVV